MNPILARKLGLAAVVEPSEESAATPMRQMRRALGRAADKTVGLSASVLGIAQDEMDAEGLIEDGPDGWVVLGLRDGASAGLTGLILMDQPLRSALIEMQTMGNLLPPADPQRNVTRTDAVMSVPFAAGLLLELAETGFGAPDFNLTGYDIGPMDDLRTAGLVMRQGPYRMWRVSIQMGGGDAQGEFLIALRIDRAEALIPTKDTTLWSAALRGAVADAPADLDAVLAHMTLPISQIEAFEVGQVVQLAGTTVGSVMLVGPDGKRVTAARLGQVAGKRAVRLETTKVELQENAPTLAHPTTAQTPQDQTEARQNTRDGVPIASPDLVDG